MANVIDYIAWRGDISFGMSPFCEVDNVIFSLLSAINYGSVLQPHLLSSPKRLDEVYEELKDSPGFDASDNHHALLKAASGSKRFGCVYMTYRKVVFSEEETVQFGAVTFILPDNSLFVAYRGTDSTLVGFREDFNISFSETIPSHALAVDYLKDVASVFKGGIRVGGHSKGGHLAEYASAFSSPDIQERIIGIYNNDGPGFLKETLESGNFRQVSQKLRVFVPQSSLVGMLLEHSADHTVIESTERNGISQHDAFTWSVVGPSFVHLNELTSGGKRNEDVMKKWLSSVEPDEKEKFINSMFDIFESTGAKSLSDLSKDSFNRLVTAIRTYGTLDQDSKSNIISSLKRFAEAFIR
ncbi:MAG: DUF2974 domain-containing protein [Clostridia bacterium]|nr:DUF2974 domain-containing protein [Clostridia bacterium]